MIVIDRGVIRRRGIMGEVHIRVILITRGVIAARNVNFIILRNLMF